MKQFIQLFIFNSLIGNPKGFKLIIKKFGWAKGIGIVLRMQWNKLTNNPFHLLNSKCEPVTWKERLSQKQILPVFALYDALISKGYSIDESILTVEYVVIGVANDFLKYTIPIIKQKDIDKRNLLERKKMFNKIVDRFPNTFGTLKVDDKETYNFTVNYCLFSAYCKQLGYSNIGPIFCKADKIYFDQHQPSIEFSRTNTLAINGKPCDFSFNLLDKKIIAKG